MSKMKRYQALDFNGNVLAAGDRLMDVHGAGNRVLVDYKARRHAIQGFYPPSRVHWNRGLSGVGDLLRSA